MGIHLTEAQAAAIEYAAETGEFYADTTTDYGRRQQVRTAEALAAKGIFTLVEHAPGQDVYGLTDLGRQVYATHPRVIRR